MAAMNKYKCVLSIDDDSVCNFIDYVLLTKLKIGEKIQIESNGHDALEFLKKYHKENNCLPELILVDILMPVMDGYEFLEALEKLAYVSPVEPVIIIVSTLLPEKDIAYLNNKGYPWFLNKPLDKERLLGILNQTLVQGAHS
jgi:CheY-like chemotaxis protein